MTESLSPVRYGAVAEGRRSDGGRQSRGTGDRLVRAESAEVGEGEERFRTDDHRQVSLEPCERLSISLRKRGLRRSQRLIDPGEAESWAPDLAPGSVMVAAIMARTDPW